MSGEWFVLVESNTTGSGRLFCATARAMSLRPVVLARDPDRYPYVRADQIDSRRVDTADVAALVAACADLRGPVAGLTSSSEYFIATANELARALGLPHADPEAIRSCRDKHIQRVRLQQAGVPGPAYAAAATPAAAEQAAADLGLPVVVKPIAGSGSIGARRCAHVDEVRQAAAEVLSADPSVLPVQDAVMVEAYVDGAEYSVETLDEHVVGITRKHLGPAPYFVEVGHDFPAPLGADAQATIGEIAVAALKALNLGWGAAHVELRLSPAGPRIIEVNPRLAGGMIPRMVQEAVGVDMISYVVAKAAGMATSTQPTRDHAASIRFLVATTDGRLDGIGGVDEVRMMPGVVDVGLSCTPGREIVLRHSFQDRLAYVIGAAPDGPTAARAAENGVRVLTVQITEGSKINGSS